MTSAMSFAEVTNPNVFAASPNVSIKNKRVERDDINGDPRMK